MAIEDHEVPRGWPLGLGNMNMRFRMAENIEAAAAATTEPNSFHAPSWSFSSFSSSNLDNEIKQSTASFFQDNSVSLGRLIGMKPRDRGILYFPNTPRILEQRSHCEPSQVHEMEVSHGICVPQLLNIIVKISRNKRQSR